VRQIIKWERAAETDKKKSRLLRDIGMRHLKTILRNDEKITKLFPDDNRGDTASERNRRLSLRNSKILRNSERRSEASASANEDGIDNDPCQTIRVRCPLAENHLTSANEHYNLAIDGFNAVISATSLTPTVEGFYAEGISDLQAGMGDMIEGYQDLAYAKVAGTTCVDDVSALTLLSNTEQSYANTFKNHKEASAYAKKAAIQIGILSTPSVPIKITCLEDDPCCDDPWAGTQVTIKNVSVPEIPAQTLETGSNGIVQFNGRFGNSLVLVTTNGPENWNVNRYLTVGPNGGYFTLLVDLPTD